MVNRWSILQVRFTCTILYFVSYCGYRNCKHSYNIRYTLIYNTEKQYLSLEAMMEASLLYFCRSSVTVQIQSWSTNRWHILK